jgi:hypothetical protein
MTMSARSPAAPSGGYEQAERGAREAAPGSAWPVRCRVAARDQHDCRCVRPFGELVRHRKPVEARQLDVEEEDGRPQRRDEEHRRPHPLMVANLERARIGGSPNPSAEILG